MHFRTFLKAFIADNPLESYEKCAVVSHSAFLTSMSSNEYDFVQEGPTNQILFKNC